MGNEQWFAAMCGGIAVWKKHRDSNIYKFNFLEEEFQIEIEEDMNFGRL
jgi:hypothetical protein